MPAPTKTITVFGLLGDIEATYGGGGALVAGTDGILLAEAALCKINYLHDGMRAPGATTGGPPVRSSPTGRWGEFTPRVEMRGKNSAYSGSVWSQELHTFLRSSGHDAAFSVDKWTYTPSSTNIDSGFYELYTRGQMWSMVGAYSDFNITVDGPGFAIAEFPTTGLIDALPTDVALPAITYDTHQPPKAINMGIDINGVTGLVVKGLRFSKSRTNSPRNDINAGGHAGYAPGRRESLTEIDVEMDSLGTLDPYALRDAGTVLSAFTWQLGSAANNIVTFAANTGSQIVDVDEGEEGEVGVWTLHVAHGVTPGADDDYVIETPAS